MTVAALGSLAAFLLSYDVRLVVTSRTAPEAESAPKAGAAPAAESAPKAGSAPDAESAPKAESAPDAEPAMGVPAPAWDFLWAHLRAYVLPHRSRLGPTKLTVLEEPADSPAALWLQRHFLARVPQRGSFTNWTIRNWTSPAARFTNKVYTYNGCGRIAGCKPAWDGLAKGSVLAVPICSAAEYEEAWRLVYTLNCKFMRFDNGGKLTCRDFPFAAAGLLRVTFVQHFFILEKMDTTSHYEKLGGGDFLKVAMGINRTTDKIRHGYHHLYERYLKPRRGPKGSLLEIGLGCNMGYGPGKSAILWRRYLPDWRIEFVEIDRRCIDKWNTTMSDLRIVVHVGDQNRVSKMLGETARGREYDVIIDDGMHSNDAITKSFNFLWPVVAPGGIYVMEDMGEPAFGYMEVEPLQTVAQKQVKTAVAQVVRLAEPLVLAQQGGPAITAVECLNDICLIQKGL